MPYITFVMSCDKEEDPGFLRFRIGGLSISQIKSSGPLQSLFERAKVTEFLGSHTVWLRIGNLGEENAPSLIGMRQEPATEAIVPFFNQFEEWGYTMVGNSPQLSTATGPNGLDVEAMTCTWIFHRSSKPTTPTTETTKLNGILINATNPNNPNPYGSPTSIKNSQKMKIPNPDY